MKRLVLVRHGESLWNVERRIQGQQGGGLSERGHDQARAAADYLAHAFSTASLFTSDLQRCKETVGPLEALLGRTAAEDLGLRERDFGGWAGRLATDIAQEEPDRWDRWRRGDDVVAEVDGESTPAFTDRVVAALTNIVASTTEGGTAICVTHGGPTWHGTKALMDLHGEALGAVANASITELIEDDSFGRRLSSWNQVSHLPVELRTMIGRTEPARRDDQPRSPGRTLAG